MQPLASLLVWSGISVLGAAAFGVLALSRGETVNAAWLLTAAVCTYAVGYRFYSKFLASRVFGLDDRRATPAERFNNGRDFVPTNKWVLFGHHFAAIAGAGPLVGPVLAAQFGFLPGTLWLVIGVVVGGAVQDCVILFCSLRRDGKSLGQMAKEEVNPAAGATAMLAVLFIMIILLAVLALIVVNALKASPWGLFTIACTIPIALLMGWWMKRWRPGSVGEASAVGAVLLLGALVAGGWVAGQPHLAPLFTHSATALTWMMMGYGFIASVLPVWMLLCPRDYLSTFLKITTILVLAIAILVILPPLRMPALTPFVSLGEGPVFAGKLFPFAFIPIACGASSRRAWARPRCWPARGARRRSRSGSPRSSRVRRACWAARRSTPCGTISRSCSRPCSSSRPSTRGPAWAGSCCRRSWATSGPASLRRRGIRV